MSFQSLFYWIGLLNRLEAGVISKEAYSFNPCSIGSVSSIMGLFKGEVRPFRFNPCSIGSVSSMTEATFLASPTACFNPCSIGSVSSIFIRCQPPGRYDCVSILVLLDRSPQFGVISRNGLAHGSFNPCSIGSVSSMQPTVRPMQRSSCFNPCSIGSVSSILLLHLLLSHK